MLSLALAMTLAVGSGALVTVALPVIGRALGISPSDAVWIVNAFQIGTVMALLPVSAAGERWGYKRVYLGGIVLLLVTGVGASMASDIVALALWRLAQGLGAAAVMGVNAALIRFIYPDRLLGRGISYNAMIIAAVGAASPGVAGVIVAFAGWRWLFLAVLPLGAAGLLTGLWALPASRQGRGRFDATGAFLNAVMFGAIFLAQLGLVGGQGWRLSAGELALGLGAALLLLRRSRGRERPMVPLDLLGIALLRWSYAASFCCFAAQTIALVALPFYLHALLDMTALGAGLVLTPWPVMLAAAALAAGRAVERYPPVLLGTGGLGLFALGLGLLAVAPHLSLTAAALATGLCGFGLGLFSMPNNRMMMAAAPLSRSGAAAGMIATVRLAGQTVGAVMVGGLFRAAGTASVLPFLGGAALALLAALLSATRREGLDRSDSRSAPSQTGNPFR